MPTHAGKPMGHTPPPILGARVRGGKSLIPHLALTQPAWGNVVLATPYMVDGDWVAKRPLSGAAYGLRYRLCGLPVVPRACK